MNKSIITKVKKLNKEAKLPQYATSKDSGADLFAAEKVIINPGETKLVHTGIAIALPDGYEAQVRSKSGLALKSEIFVLNSPGTVDNAYRGEVGVILHNIGTKEKIFEIGDKIAQMVIVPVEQSDFVEVDELDETDRGQGGFGSTGK